MEMPFVFNTVGTGFLNILFYLFERILRWFTYTRLLLCASHAALRIQIDQNSSLQRPQNYLFKLCDSSLIQKIKASIPRPCSDHYLRLQRVLTQWYGLSVCVSAAAPTLRTPCFLWHMQTIDLRTHIHIVVLCLPVCSLKVKFSLCLISQAHRHEDVMESGGIARLGSRHKRMANPRTGCFTLRK
jgi:hypothetical protein